MNETTREVIVETIIHMACTGNALTDDTCTRVNILLKGDWRDTYNIQHENLEYIYRESDALRDILKSRLTAAEIDGTLFV